MRTFTTRDTQIPRRQGEPVPAGPSPQRPEIRSILAGSGAASVIPAAITAGVPAAGGLAPGAKREEVVKAWQGIRVLYVPKGDSEEQEQKRKLGLYAAGRLFDIPEGLALVEQLCRIFAGRKQSIHIHFVDKLKEDDGNTGGFVEPGEPDRARYDVYVKNQPLDRPGEAATYSDWPGGSKKDITSFSTDAVSRMATTLFHELLHIWFLHAHRRAEHKTGHGPNVQAGDIEDAFWARLSSFAAQQDKFTERSRGSQGL